MLSDEVWRQLDPGAGRLSRRTAVRLWLAAVVAVVVAGLGFLVWDAGLVVARLEEPSDHASWEVTPGQSATYYLEVHNAGRIPVTITGAGRSGPGLELIRVDGTLPVVLEPGQATTFGLVYRVTDCAAAPREAWPVPLTVDGPWFTHTVYPFRQHDPPEPWQQLITETWCEPPP